MTFFQNEILFQRRLLFERLTYDGLHLNALCFPLCCRRDATGVLVASINLCNLETAQPWVGSRKWSHKTVSLLTATFAQQHAAMAS
jgi:hypothetical protein